MMTHDTTNFTFFKLFIASCILILPLCHLTFGARAKIDEGMSLEDLQAQVIHMNRNMGLLYF